MNDPRQLNATIRFMLRREDRDEIEQIARTHDRSLSAEVRHALKFYRAALRERRRGETKSSDGAEP